MVCDPTGVTKKGKFQEKIFETSLFCHKCHIDLTHDLQTSVVRNPNKLFDLYNPELGSAVELVFFFRTGNNLLTVVDQHALSITLAF